MSVSAYHRIAVVAVVMVLSALIGVSTEPVRVMAQSSSEVWAQPINLSNSGAASQPVIAAESNGTLHALWWDKFDGTKYAFYSPKKNGWSTPVTVFAIVGGRTIDGRGKVVITPPKQLKILSDGLGQVHAFWIDTEGNLRYAYTRSGSDIWSGGFPLVESVLAWDVMADSRNVVHLAFIRLTDTAVLPSGVYYSRSTLGGGNWETPKPIYKSLYFRTIAPQDAYVTVASNSEKEVLVAWDDPLLKQSFYTRSTNGGVTFGGANAILTSGLDKSAVAQHARFLSEPGSKFLMLWEVGGACTLYQQQSSGNNESWAPPVRVLETLGGCSRMKREYSTADGKPFLVVQLVGASGAVVTGTSLMTWNGSRWSQPLMPQIKFVATQTNGSTTLGCMDATVSNDRVVVIGCDQSGDIWVTTSQLKLADLLPVLKTAWSPPVILSKSKGDAGLPAVTVDADGRLHVLWSVSPAGGPGAALTYVRGDGLNWSAPAVVLSSPKGKAESPSIVADPGGMLHTVWSGGYTGEIFYSQAFIRDAVSSSSWSSPKPLPAPRMVGGWPDLAVDDSGSLHAVYAIPLNEDRGVYYTRSKDRGTTWSEPRLVFDTAQAGWAMVRQTSLVVDGRGRLHVVWARAALPEDNSPLGVYYARSDDGGQSWTAALEIAGDVSDRSQIIAASSDQIHLVWIKTATAGPELWHQWSPDGGVTWSAGERVPGLLRNISPNVGLVADGTGVVYLAGIERTQQDSVALFYLRWDGQSWVDRESVRLGYDPADGSGATAILFASGQGGQPRLGVFYRVRALIEGGGSHYVVGYTQRLIEGSVIAPAATFTPRAVKGVPPTTTVASTLTPIATADLSSVPATAADNLVWLQIGGALVGMLVVVVLAARSLRGGRRQ